jgi:hypothetical protein
MKILIYYDTDKAGMTDVYGVELSHLSSLIRLNNGKFPNNVGNKVWLQSVISELSTPENLCELGYENLAVEEINSRYDCVVMPLANCFHAGWIPWMKKRTEHILKLKIPVYVIGCGIQSNSYDDINNLVASCRKPATEFINAVYETGGEWALRGYHTADFFGRLGFKNAVVTGCPSLYQIGRDLCISNTKVALQDFKAVINGTFQLPITHEDYKACDFICQSTYGNILFDPTFFEHNQYTIRYILKKIKRGDRAELEAIADQRIHLFLATQKWLDYFSQKNISFSFGSRIHGNIMAILAKVPSLLLSCDSRTREMAEFFEIPFVYPSKKVGEKHRLYDLYLKTDYSGFNKKFASKFDAYEDFLTRRGLVTHLNQKNPFMKLNASQNESCKHEYINATGQKKLQKKLKIMSPLIWLIERFFV